LLRKKYLRDAFSMSDVKTLNPNKIIAERIFLNLDLDRNNKKIRTLCREILFLGSIAVWQLKFLPNHCKTNKKQEIFLPFTFI
jgi:hypothetical protein